MAYCVHEAAAAKKRSHEQATTQMLFWKWYKKDLINDDGTLNQVVEWSVQMQVRGQCVMCDDDMVHACRIF